MNLVDIIALAKAGYKPADIKELIALAPPEPTPEPKAAEQTETGIDYKAMYEASQEELARVKNEALEAQRANNSADTTVQRVDELEALKDIFR